MLSSAHCKSKNELMNNAAFGDNHLSCLCLRDIHTTQHLKLPLRPIDGDGAESRPLQHREHVASVVSSRLARQSCPHDAAVAVNDEHALTRNTTVDITLQTSHRNGKYGEGERRRGHQGRKEGGAFSEEDAEGEEVGDV